MSEFFLSKITGQETPAEVQFCGFLKKLKNTFLQNTSRRLFLLKYNILTLTVI